MASIPPSTWSSVPRNLASPSSASYADTPSGAKIVLLPPKKFKYCRALSASSSEDGASSGETDVPDHVRLAFSKANAYRKGKMFSTPREPVNAPKPSMESDVEARGSGGSEPDVPIAVKLAMEKAKENKKNKQASVEEPRDPGEEDKSLRNSRKGSVESKLKKKDELKVSSKDFLGLNFSEKKSYRGKPPGLVTPVGPLLEGDVPEVEIIVGDVSKFERTPQASSSSEVIDRTGLYKPKVSTWGVFPRPNNISKTFGGGRVIEAGGILETPEAKEAKEKRSRELISAYKKKMGLTVDVKTRAECEKALKEGDGLMDRGQLRGALPYYEMVMKNLIFQSELHGLAALQWSICQDSLSRLEEEDEVEGEEEEEERERKWEGMVGNLKGGRKKKENGEKEGEGRKKKKNGGRGMEEEEEEGRGRRRNLPWKLGWRGKGVAGGLDRGRTEGSGGFGVKCRGMRVRGGLGDEMRV
ncbi:hypothetical protein M5K25_019109 [Dendrobium thyrsiflorum]|uniref:Uncharacterized protein n=1 Tax=Dendrobium thyrsiflorum TaxID=117978 RepID=A0ABD0UE35_DENTH